MNKPVVTKDFENKRMIVERMFDAPRSKVWEAWTKSELLEKWWAPKPWKAVTKTFEFKVGGHWLYYMLGPEGEKSWCWAGYTAIDAENSFEAEDAFCDENGVKSSNMPAMKWRNEFYDEGDKTKVIVTTQFTSLEDMEKTLKMGVEEGFSMALENLDEVLNTMKG